MHDVQIKQTNVRALQFYWNVFFIHIYWQPASSANRLSHRFDKEAPFGLLFIITATRSRLGWDKGSPKALW